MYKQFIPKNLFNHVAVATMAFSFLLFTPFANAQVVDTDGDTIADIFDIDKDNDGITDSTELPVPVSAAATASAISWRDSNGYEVFVLSNPATAAAGYIESGYARAVEIDGFSVLTTVANDFSVDTVSDTATFTGGDVELIDDPVDNPSINLNETIDNNFRSGSTGNALLVSPSGGANSSPATGPVITVRVNFDSPIRYFSLDLVDLLDAGATGAGNNSSNVEFQIFAGNTTTGEELVASISTGLVGDNETGNVDIFSADGGPSQGSLLVGQSIETAVGLHASRNINYVKVVYRYVDDSVISSLDFFGVDNFVFAGTVLRDTDGDSIGDHLDLDSDNDGISDLYESGADVTTFDTDGNGVINTVQDSGVLANSVGSNGLDDRIESAAGVAGQGTVPVDTFNTAVDNLADYLDLDSDDDGIPDAVEGRVTAAYVNYPNLTDATDDDADNDGILDIFDTASPSAFGGNVLSLSSPNDADNDATPDYLDVNSDKDDQNDNAEGGSLVTGVAYTDPDGNISDPASGTVLPLIAGTSQAAYRGYVVELVSIADANVNENALYTGPTDIFQTALPTGVNATALEYTLTGNDAADFTVSAAGVVSMVARDFESPVDSNTDNSYEVGLMVDGPGGQSDAVSWTVTVDDVQEVANFTINALATTNINENAQASIALTLSGDTPIGDLVYTLTGDDGTRFVVAAGMLNLAAQNFEAPLDSNADNSYTVTVTATDSDNNTASTDWVVNIQDVQEAANFTIDAIADVVVDETGNYTSTTPALSGDAPIGLVTYSLSGADAALLSINVSTGVVTLAQQDFEAPADANGDNIYEVTLIATDEDNNSAMQSWSVSIADVTEASRSAGNTDSGSSNTSSSGGGGSTGLFLLALLGWLGIRRRSLR